MNTSQIGDLCELIVLSKLIEEGKNIALPYGNQPNWDILVENDGIWYKLQIKSAHFKPSGSLEVDCIKNGSNRKYDNGAFDYLVAVHFLSRRIWKIPFSIIYRRRAIVLTDGYLWYKV